MDLLSHALLLEIQRRFAKVLPKSVDVKKEFSNYWSFHWGLTQEAQNAGIHGVVIQANNQSEWEYRLWSSFWLYYQGHGQLLLFL